jgi:Tetracyclin repressor-like, C-terminal domain
LASAAPLRLVGEFLAEVGRVLQRTIEAARTLTAWASGFIGMELAGTFNLSGDIERAFAYEAAAWPMPSPAPG